MKDIIKDLVSRVKFIEDENKTLKIINKDLLDKIKELTLIIENS